MSKSVIYFSAGLLIIGICAAEFGEEKIPMEIMSVQCLECICQAESGCDRLLGCDGDTCGLFHITWPYWADAGKPTIGGRSPDAPDAYPSCTNDPYCAATTVLGYMSKFGKDCNGDRKIDCADYMAIHKKGGYTCNGDLPPKYLNDFNQCMANPPQHTHTEAVKSE